MDLPRNELDSARWRRTCSARGATSVVDACACRKEEVAFGSNSESEARTLPQVWNFDTLEGHYDDARGPLLLVLAESNMSLRIVRLGTPRARGEGPRIGTVRRPPRGVPKSKFASGNWYDVWFPTLAPSAEAVKSALSSTTPAQWARFTKRYRSEMAKPEAKHALDLLAALSKETNLSVGCYCEDEDRCHRSILRGLLVEHGAHVEPSPRARGSR